MMSLPSEISLTLEETETIYLFEMPSVTVAKQTDEGELVEKINQRYDHLTVGKGRNRKTKPTEVQTSERILKTRFTLAPQMKNENNYAFASAWDMFDSFLIDENKRQLAIKRKAKSLSIAALVGENRTRARRNTVFEAEDSDECRRLLRCPRFFDSIIIMERVLANNTFKLQQELFKGLIELAFTINDSKNKYQLDILWTYHNYQTKNKPVTAMCSNTHNHDIFAVGYGKFKYSDKRKGAICIWTIKNPMQPERIYHFRSGVTSLAFSNGNPNLLAVGFYNGDVIVIDVTFRQTKIISQSSRKTSPTYESIWYVRWYYAEDFDIDTEQIIAVGHDGRVNRFLQTKTDDFLCMPLMRITQTDLRIKTEDDEEQSKSNVIPVLRNPPCLVFCQHPILKDIYFVGTAFGQIYKCSTNYLTQHVSILLAHDGPVYSMEFSRFCPRIFITCGADWTVKIWMEDVPEPLIILTTAMGPVLAAAFSPTHSTIIAAISGTDVFIWDIKQKTDMLATNMTLPSTLSQLTILQFTQNGKNIIIADTKGGVQIYSLLGVPSPLPDGRQADLLESSLTKALIIKPHLLKKFSKVGKLT